MAGKILDRFSERALAAPAVTMTFDLTIKDAAEQTEETFGGMAVIKTGMYKIEMPDNIIWYNGEAVWTLAPEVEEVTITEPDPGDDTFISDPTALFTIYREGYKYRVVEEVQQGSVIDLYPDDLAAEFSRIRLLVDREGSLKEAEYMRKDGITLFIKIRTYDLKKDYPATYFIFDTAKYRNVEVIDMREG